MTTNNNGFRGFAIATLLAVGIVTTIASGGGGGSGGTIVQPPGAGPTLPLTAANAPTVSSTLIVAIGMAFDIGDITDFGLPIQALGISAPKDTGNFKIEPAVAEAPDISPCVNGGTVDTTATLADPNTLTVGDRIIAVFDNCDDAEGYTISGTADLTVSSYQGDFLTEVFLLGFDVTLSDIVIDDGLESVTANASFTLTLDNLDFPVLGLNLAGSELRFSSAGEVIALTNFDHDLKVDIGVFPETVVALASGTLEIQSLSGTIDYTTPVAVEAAGDLDPHKGEILITGANGSSIRILVVDTSNVTLEIDVNGDGVVDEYVYTNWSALNGNT
ncbi:MAG: hypothetical protein WBM87_11710 [Woeseiaceae bacterium]